ncbi:MAG: lipid-A-disaccharide synthase [Bacteroidales bacterium]|nr:MAG: lipid-A-disaccharide synthase [Bacteroidales bacterium]
MKYYIIAGEASGDLHGSNLMKGLKKSDHEAMFRFWGGDLMRSEGEDLVRHYRDLAFMGFIEVIRNIGTVKRNLDYCKKDILNYSPDLLILIDYPGFNLRMAQFASGKGIKVFYYISPKVWAWRESRVKKIRKYVDRMFVILPFEVDFYGRYDYNVEYHGNPVVDAVDQATRNMVSRNTFLAENNLPDKPVIGLLPGSRRQEIRYMLPIMLEVTNYYPDHQFLVACSPTVDTEFYRGFTKEYDVTLLVDKTYTILRHSEAALVTSGTATLEAALLNVPEVVCYKGNPVSYFIADRIVNITFISLVNLIMDDEVVRELLQSELVVANLKTELDKILFDKTYRKIMLLRFDELKKRLGQPGVSERIAGRMVALLKE